MSSFPVPGSSSHGPDYTDLPNYVRRSPVPVGPPVPWGPSGPAGPTGRYVLGSAPYRPWRAGTLTFLVGLAVEVTGGVLLGFVGFMVLMGSATDPASIDPGSLVGAVLVVLAVVVVLRLIVQARFLRGRGGARPGLSCVLALVASIGSSAVLASVGLVLLAPFLSRLAEVATIAAVSRPAPPAGHRA